MVKTFLLDSFGTLFWAIVGGTTPEAFGACKTRGFDRAVPRGKKHQKNGGGEFDGENEPPGLIWNIFFPEWAWAQGSRCLSGPSVLSTDPESSMGRRMFFQVNSRKDRLRPSLAVPGDTRKHAIFEKEGLTNSPGCRVLPFEMLRCSPEMVVRCLKMTTVYMVC